MILLLEIVWFFKASVITNHSFPSLSKAFVLKNQRLISKGTTVDRLAVVGPPGIHLHHGNVHNLENDVDEKT